MFLIVFALAINPLPAQEEENFRRVLRLLEQMPSGILVEERSLFADFGGFSSSLLVSSQLEDIEKANGTFVFAVPLSAEFAVDTALAMVERLGYSSKNILVAFLGGETNELPIDMGGITHKGLRDLLSLTETPENWVLCYFDVCAAPSKLVINHGFHGYVTPLELITPLPPLFVSHGIPFSFRIRQNTIYKLGLVEGPEALSITWGEQVNGFVFSGETENGNLISPGDLAALLLEYTGFLNFPVLNPEKHYAFITLPDGRIFFISELMMVSLMLLTLGVLFLLYLFYSVRYNAILLFHIRLFFRYFLIFIALLSFMIISFKLSGFLYSSLVSVLNIMPRVSNQAGLFLTIFLSLIVFYFSSYVLDIIRIPLRERFFRFASVIFLIFSIISAVFLDFSYISIFLIVFVLFFLGALVQNPIIVFIIAFSLPVFGLITLSNIFITDNERLTELFISISWNTPDSWLVIYHTALLLLPVFLLLKRGSMLTIILRRLKIKYSKIAKLKILPALILITVVSIVIQIIIPVRELPPDRRLIAQALTSENNEILALSVDDFIFLDSRIVTLNLAARGSPVRFDVSILSGTDRILLPLYSAPVPIERKDEGKRVTLNLGEFPPNPLVIEIVVPLEFQGRLELAAIYNIWDSTIDPGEKPVTKNYILTVTKSQYL